MDEFKSVEAAIDPNNRISFLIDWEITLKCNLDCSYCPTGIYGSHDNSTQHPPVEECFKSIEFLYQYVDLYLSQKVSSLRNAILNVYGGESLHHPQIKEILEKCRAVYNERYRDRWPLTVTTTTNAIISPKKLDDIIPLIDEFTVSYHTEASPKQKKQFKDNLIKIRDSGKRLKCVILMHAEKDLFSDAQGMMKWCEENRIDYLPRQLDSGAEKIDFSADSVTKFKPKEKFGYTEHQVTWFESFYDKKGGSRILEKKYQHDRVDLADTGRACCGGRSLCADQNYKQKYFFVDNKFPDWYCSVNEFFVFMKQITKEIFVNKDCMMNFDGSVGPIGHLDEARDLLRKTSDRISNSETAPIQCKRYKCRCGLCAPKAKDLQVFNRIMEKYRT